MKRILLTVVTAGALAFGGWLTSTAEAHGPGYRYGCYPGGVGLSVGYGYPGVNIAYRGPNVAFYAPNIAYSSGFVGGRYGYGSGCYSNPYAPYGAGYAGGYQSYARPRVGFYYGY